MKALRPAQRFANLVRASDGAGIDVPLDRACLFSCAVFDSSIDPAAYSAKLDDLAAEAGAASTSAHPYALAGAVLDTLFRKHRFRGNEPGYYDPTNSLLSSVIDKRVGIPITLSIVLMEVARRVGLELDGVGLPGHFIVRFPDETSRLYIDPFDGGRILDVHGCVALFDKLYRGRLSWREEYLQPVSHRAILKRVLLNLKNSLSQAKNYVAALAAIELQLAVDPDDPTELRDRGILFARLHRYDRAIADLEAYLRRLPDAGDGDHIRNTVQYLRQARGL